MTIRATILVAALCALAALATLAPSAGAVATAAQRTVATAQSVDFRATLVVAKTSAGSAPTARATLKLYREASGSWRPVSTTRIAGTYFWKSVTGPRAVCRLELSTVTQPGIAGHVVVQLLETPALGCAPAQTVPLPGR